MIDWLIDICPPSFSTPHAHFAITYLTHIFTQSVSRTHSPSTLLTHYILNHMHKASPSLSPSLSSITFSFSPSLFQSIFIYPLLCRLFVEHHWWNTRYIYFTLPLFNFLFISRQCPAGRIHTYIMHDTKNRLLTVQTIANFIGCLHTLLIVPQPKPYQCPITTFPYLPRYE